MDHPFSHPSLSHLRLDVRLRVESDIIWGSFPGSVVHGALGFTARHFSCVAKSQQCEDCFLLDSCFYPRLFQTPTPKDTSRMKKYPHIPPGLRISIDPWDGDVIHSGEVIRLQAVLFGSASNAVLSLLLTIAEAFRRGVGRKRGDQKRGTAVIEGIFDASGKRLWRTVDEKIDLSSLKPSVWGRIATYPKRSFNLIFTSPTRIVSKGKVSGSPSFRDISSTVLRRITNIAYFYCGEELQADFKGMLDQAAAVKHEGRFKRVKRERYSAHQKRRMTMDGIIGTMHVEDCPEELLPWIALGCHLGIGKGTSMGMGRYEIREQQIGESDNRSHR
jgi:hypothetical protein